VERVLTRRHAIADPVRDRDTQRRLWDLARELLPTDAPGDFNQAMMELGATVCTPRAPACDACPVVMGCRARDAGNPEDYPVKPPRGAIPHHDIAVAIVVSEGRVLMVRRPPSGLLGGLWEFPGGRVATGETISTGLTRGLKERFGLDISPGAALVPVRHAFTHRRVTLHPFTCRKDGGTVTPVYHTTHRWVPRPDLEDMALPRAHRRIVAALETRSDG